MSRKARAATEGMPSTLSKILYMVGVLKQSVEVADLERQEKYVLPCSWAEGMVGAFPVFDSKEAAEKYLGGPGSRYQIIAYEVEEPVKQ